jgi:thiamine biosynthesis lipoprotein
VSEWRTIINKIWTRKSLFILSICLSMLLMIGCSAKDNGGEGDKLEPITKTAFKLNTMVTITLYDSISEEILDGAFAICDKYENIYSRTLETSELYKLNNKTLEMKEGSKDSYYISDELKDILNYGLKYSNLSGGNFDITIEPISSLWEFTSEEPFVPDKEIIDSNLGYVNYKNLELNNNVATFKNENMGIDLGAIAKGYIADRIKDYLISEGVQSAMINLGGNVLCVGSKTKEVPFNIGIQKPFADRNEIVATMELRDVSVVSSGIYERSFTEDGKSYHHILNPSTGYPYDNGLISVTIISEKSVDGDGLSTSCFALGLEKGLELINSLPNTYAVFITDDYVMHYSKGFHENIKVKEVE